MAILQFWFFLLFCSALLAAAPLEPVSVCEILNDTNAFEGKTVAVLGRYSFRSTGRWLSEDHCDAKPKPGETDSAPVVWVFVDAKSAPEAPPVLEIDETAAGRKLAHMKQQTSLQKFRFGSSDYDRWAIVYGRVERRAPDALQRVAAPKPGNPDAATAPLRLLIHGDALIVFLAEP